MPDNLVLEVCKDSKVILAHRGLKGYKDLLAQPERLALGGFKVIPVL
jgi:hypothetical protein